MSDATKIVAAILTAGRMPMIQGAKGAYSMEDWMAEYVNWLKALYRYERDEAQGEASDWIKGMSAAFGEEANR